MLKNVLTHWKTSLAGAGLGGTAFTIMQSGCGATSWKSWAVALGITGLGLIAKDPGKPAQ